MKRQTICGFAGACSAFALVGGGLLAQAAYADNWFWSGWREIEAIYGHDGGTVLILAGDTVDANSSCPNRFIIKLEDPNYDAKASIAITGYARRDSINLEFDDDFTGCNTPVDRFQVTP